MVDVLNLEKRKYMLESIWSQASLDFLVHEFMDGSKAIFAPGLKLELIGERLEMFSTRSDIYNIMPTYAVWYAYENGLKMLADACKYTNALKKSKQSDGITDRKHVTELLDTVAMYEKLNLITLNQIKESYDTKISKKVSLTNQLT